MTKVLVSIDDKLLARVDRAAKKQGLSRSAYIARLAARDTGAAVGPGRSRRVHEAMRKLDALFAKYPTPGDPVALVRAERDAH